MKKMLALGIMALWSLIMVCQALAAQITLSWDKNTEPTVVGYRVYSKVENGAYDKIVCQGNITTCTIFNLSSNIAYSFTVRAYDATGRESGNSNEIFFKQFPQENYLGTYACDGYEYGIGNYYWNVQPINPRMTFARGQTIYFLSKLSKVYTDHQWKIQLYLNNSLSGELLSGWQYPDHTWGWDYSVMEYYLANVPAGSWRAEVYLKTSATGSFQLMQNVAFTVEQMQAINLPYYDEDFINHGYTLEDHHNTASLQFSSTEGMFGGPGLVVSGGLAGENWQLQIKKLGFKLQNGNSYNGSVWLKSENPGKVYLSLQREVSPWDNMGLWQALSVSTQWRQYSFDFVAKGNPEYSSENVRFSIMLGELSGKLWLDGVSLLAKNNLPANLPYLEDFEDYYAEHGFLLEDHNQTAGLYASQEGYNGGDCLVVENNLLTDFWNVQVKKSGINLQNGVYYDGSIYLKADRPGIIYLALQRDISPWDNLGLWKQVNVTTAWQKINFNFTTFGNVKPGEYRLAIMVGQFAGKLFIDNIGLK